jgi:hypothetical protein
MSRLRQLNANVVAIAINATAKIAHAKNVRKAVNNGKQSALRQNYIVTELV